MPVDLIGQVEVDKTDGAVLTCHTYGSNGAPATPASAPTFTIYDPTADAAMPNGTGVGALLRTAIYKATKTLSSVDGYAANNTHVVIWTWTTGSTEYAYERRLLTV